MEKVKIYILLTDTGTLFTRMIKLYTKKPYNHASISFDDKLKEVYSFGRKKPRNPFIGGFVKEDLQGELFINARCVVYSCYVSNEQLEKMKTFIKKIEKNKRLYRYNVIGLLTFIINKPYQREHSYFCSQFVAHVLNAGEIIEFQKPLSLISPNDFTKINNFHIEYEGTISNLVRNKNANQIYSFS